MTPVIHNTSDGLQNNANLAKSPQVINAMNLGAAMRSSLVPWREVAQRLHILKDNGEPDTGLAYKIVMEGYEPKTLKTRTRLGWPPICSACHQKVRKSRPDVAYTRTRRERLDEIARKWGFENWSNFETWQLKSN